MAEDNAAAPRPFLSGAHDGDEGRCGSRPHFHVTLGGTVTRRPTLFNMARPVCEVRALFNEGVGDAPPICLSVIVMGPDATTCRSSLDIGSAVEFSGILVGVDTLDGTALPGPYYCGMGGLGVKTSAPTAVVHDGAASVPLAQIVLVAESADQSRSLTPDKVLAINRGVMTELEDVIPGGEGGLSPILA